MNSVGYRYRPRAGLIPRCLESSAAGIFLGGGGILHCAIPPWEHDASLDESEAYQPSMGLSVLLPEKFERENCVEGQADQAVSTA